MITPLRKSTRTPSKKTNGPTPSRSPNLIGVKHTRQGWIGEITFQSKKISSEPCETPEEAGYQRDRLSVHYRGGIERAGKLNFPERFRDVDPDEPKLTTEMPLSPPSKADAEPCSLVMMNSPPSAPVSVLPQRSIPEQQKEEEEKEAPFWRRSMWWLLVVLPVMLLLVAMLIQQHSPHLKILGGSETSDSTPDTAACTVQVDTNSLVGQLEAGQVWQEWAENVAEEIRGKWRAREGHPKALTMLLASHKGSVRWKEVASSLSTVTPWCTSTGCFLSLDASAFNQADAAEGRGALEKQLVTFFKHCPRGLLLIQGVHQLDISLYPALLPAISEGGLYTYDGLAVPTTQATVILTIKSKAAHKWTQSDEETYSKNVKNSLEKELLKSFSPSASVTEDEATTYARAFRRRIDFVAPLTF